MKRIIILFLIISSITLSASCAGNRNVHSIINTLELANTQEIDLNNITEIKISYSSERVSLFIGTTDKLIIKEYMNINNPLYYANITRSGNTITIQNGQWPIPIINNFNRRAEIYLPVSYNNNLDIKTSSGRIESTVDLSLTRINIESSSGNINLNNITADSINLRSSSGRINANNVYGDTNLSSSSGNIEISLVTGLFTARSTSGRIQGEQIKGYANLNTSSGNINIGRIDGNVTAVSTSGRIELNTINGSADVRTSSGNIIGRINGDVKVETTSGRIDLNITNGSVEARTSSGSINCKIEPAGNISFTTTSGRVDLSLPRNINFNFTSRTTSGRLSTPFSDRLFIPANDRNLTQGVINNNNTSGEITEINIRTSSGSINVNWI